MMAGPSRHMNRRSFLRNVSAAAGAAVAAPYVLTSDALGRDGKPAASDRIVVGAIGTGGQGTGDMRGCMGSRQVQMVAVCDVDRKHAESAKKHVDGKYGNSDCKVYGDFRQITRREDIDAVVVGTPDHWHVLPAIDAARHRKDAYVEKPLTLTIAEGRALADVVNRYGRVLQTGSQQRSSANFRFGCELVRNGRIGKVQKVTVGIPGNNKRCEPTWTPQTPPAELDYNYWLGQARWEPYHRQRCHYQFRFILDYSGGQVTNWGAHHLDIAQWGLGMDDSGPVSIIGNGEFPTTGLFTTATRVHFECEYAGGVKLTCKTGGGGTLFEGTEGSVYVNRGKISTKPASLLREKIAPSEIHLYESRSHMGNFLECIRTRRKPICNEEVGHRSASICHLGNIAMLLGRKLHWDARAERFINDNEANSMISRTMREPWHL